MIVAISMVRDEADVVGHTVARMVEQVDRVVILDNGSSDGTGEVCRRLGAEVRDDPDPAYYQSRKLSALAAEMRADGAEWVVPFDADELWSGQGRPIGQVLAGLPDWIFVCEAALFDHVATRQDPNGGDPIRSLNWRRAAPAPLPKWAVRAVDGLVIHQGNHGATFPDEPRPPIIKHLLGIRHFPYRTPDQLIRKVRNGAPAYQLTDLPEDLGAHWRQWGRMTDEQLEQLFYTWYWRDDPQLPVTIEGEDQPALVYDPPLI